VIPPRKSVTLFYHLTEWALTSGPTTARLELPQTDCLTYFQSTKTSLTRKLLSYQFTVHLAQLRH